MKKMALCILAVSTMALWAQPTNSSPEPSAEISPAAVLATMQRVADWQLTNSAASHERYGERAWTYGALYAGMMALAEITDSPKYYEAMVAKGKGFNWEPAPRPYYADDHCVAQMYLECYLKERDPAMLRPIRQEFDQILAHPATNVLEFTTTHSQDRWSWCDALFMAPPVWVRLYQATGDRRYLDFMDREWRATSDFLYDTNEHLFFRDSTFFKRREANGAKIFWSRGNGWVIAGLARIIPFLPADFSGREFYVQKFREMAKKVASLQQPDGLWRSSLLDPEAYPLKETSGSGFYTFALAWGINQGLLDRATYEPVVRRGWQALVECVTPDGKLEHVQPVGSDPKKFLPTDTDVFGPGAFLLAGRQVYQFVGGQVRSAK